MQILSNSGVTPQRDRDEDFLAVDAPPPVRQQGRFDSFARAVTPSASTRRAAISALTAAGTVALVASMVKPVTACPTECYRSVSADQAMVALAAATGLLFGAPGVFVGAGAGMMTRLYIERIK